MQSHAHSPITGGYLLETDPVYNPAESPCFRLNLSWIFATSTQIQDSIRAIQRRAKEFDFDMVPVSTLVLSEHLNPFEISTVLRNASPLYLNVQ